MATFSNFCGWYGRNRTLSPNTGVNTRNLVHLTELILPHRNPLQGAELLQLWATPACPASLALQAALAHSQVFRAWVTALESQIPALKHFQGFFLVLFFFFFLAAPGAWGVPRIGVEPAP